MATSRAAGLDVGRLLEGIEDAPPGEAADVLGLALAETFGATEMALLIADLSGESLVRLGSQTRRPANGSELVLKTETAQRIPLTGTPPGRALARQSIEVQRVDDGWRLYAPVTNRGEAIGLLELALPAPPSDRDLAEIALAGHVLAYVIIANRRFTDLYEWGQRTVPLSLAAEIQRRLLPDAYTCEAGQFTLAAWLEPAGEVAGDTFDFSLERHCLHLSMTDAMGHGVQAALLATVLVGGLRNARRAGLDLAEQASQASAGLAGEFRRSEFVTGQVVRIDLDTGTAQAINAGHPLPLRLRNGEVSAIELRPDLPFALGRHEYRVQPFPLEPGDRLFFLTDGALERNAANVDMPAVIRETASMHPREAVQQIVYAVLDATRGDLRDDAAVLCLDWHGGAPRPRTTDAGANA